MCLLIFVCLVPQKRFLEILAFDSIPKAFCRVSNGAGIFVPDILVVCWNFYLQKRFLEFFPFDFHNIHICIANGAKLSFASVNF